MKEAQRTPHSKIFSKSSNQSESTCIDVIALTGMPLLKPGDDLTRMIIDAINENKIAVERGDILVIAHTIVSIVEGNVIRAKDVTVTQQALKIAQHAGQKPEKVQTALDEAADVLYQDPVLITRTKHGIVTDMSGVDESNAPPGCYVTLPNDPDISAAMISKRLSDEYGFQIPVLIADTQGRPWRQGAVNLTIGLSGMSPFTENTGRKDLFGRQLRSSLVCIADELVSAAELVMGQADEGIPVVLIRGLKFEHSQGSASSILRSRDDDLFS